MPLRLVAVVIGIVFAAAGPASVAQTGNRDVFTVPEVPVFAEAESAAEAQRAAQEQGRRRAMDLLLRRLTADEDWQYLPTLANALGDGADTAVRTEEAGLVDELNREFGGDFAGEFGRPGKQTLTLGPDGVAALEEGFSIFDEKTSARTYRARITYRFKPQGVRALLERAGLPYSEAQARKALIVPVLKTDEGLYLWESRNPWARAWLARPLVNELTPLELPLGDQEDIATAPVEAVAALDRVVLKPLADRYGVSQVIVALGDLEREDGEYRLSVKLIDAYRRANRAASGGGPGAEEQVALTPEEAALLYDDADGFGAERAPTVNTEGGDKGPAPGAGAVLTETFFRGPADDFPALAQRAVESTVSRHARSWKRQTLVDHSLERPMTLNAWYGDVGEWADIRTALERSPLTRSMEIPAFTNENAVIRMTLIGSEEQLILAMSQANLTVWQSPDGAWNIAGNDRAERLQRNGIASGSPSSAGTGPDLQGYGRDPGAQRRDSSARRGIFSGGRRGRRPMNVDEEIPALPDDLFSDEDAAPVVLEPGGPETLAPSNPTAGSDIQEPRR